MQPNVRQKPNTYGPATPRKRNQETCKSQTIKQEQRNAKNLVRDGLQEVAFRVHQEDDANEAVVEKRGPVPHEIVHAIAAHVHIAQADRQELHGDRAVLNLRNVIKDEIPHQP